MQQVYNITNAENEHLNNNYSENAFLQVEQIVKDIVNSGLDDNCNKENEINKIKDTYGLSYNEAKSCFNLAHAQIETETEEEQEDESQLYRNSGYYYPTHKMNQVNSYTPKTSQKNDGMDSLSSLGSYNKIMFGLR